MKTDMSTDCYDRNSMGDDLVVLSDVMMDLTSCWPLLAQSRHTNWGMMGTEVRILNPPINQTFWM